MFARAPRSAMTRCGSNAGRSLAMDGLHICVLASLALAQPAYDRLGDRPAFLLNLGTRPPVVFLVMAVLSLALPAAILLLECLAWLCARRMRDAVHAIAMYLLTVLLALPLLKRASFLPGEVAFVGSLVTAGVAVWGYFEFARVRTYVTLCAMGIVFSPAAFLLSSSVTSILFPPQTLRPGRWTPVPTVVLVFDELCGASLMNVDREIDADRFPNLAELSRQATWFRNATTVHTETEQAVPAILSGKYPTTAWSPVTADRPQNLFSVLDSAGGYELAVFEPVTNLAPRNRVRGAVDPPGIGRQAAVLLETLARVYLFHVTPQDFHRHLPPIPALWYGMSDSRDVDRTLPRGVFRYGWEDQRDRQFDHFLSCLDGSSRPTLYFMHLLAPHVPWSYLPSGHRYTDDFDKRDLMNFNAHSGLLDFWGQDEWLVVQSQQRYLLQLAWLDQLIGRLVERLKETGLYDRSLLIVTADHGVAFRANRPRRMTAPDTLGDILSIPLFIKRPHQTSGEISDRHVESVDILPTVADVLGIELSEPADGWSAFDDSRPERRSKTLVRDETPVAVDPTIAATSDVPALIRGRFGEARDPQAIFRLGPIPELLDRPVASLPQSPKPPTEIEFIRYGDFAGAGAGELFPCFFEGRVRTPMADQPTILAVAVNGTIRAVTRTYLLDGFRDRWAALVPESSFQPGKNDVQFFVVTGDAPDWQLSPCTSRGPPR
jgi:hypothetical protein